MLKKKKPIPDGANHDLRTLHKNLNFSATEQYKLLRANLSFALPDDVACPIIGITSSVRGEGKSTTAINLSYVLAEAGKRVLLIDGDLRLPSIAKKMRIASTPGLSDYLKGTKSSKLSLFPSELFANWCIMPSGPLPPNPSELLGSVRMKNVLTALQESFDCIIMDLPPVNIVSDALAVSQFLTGMLVIVREDFTEKRELDSCVRQLELSNVKLLGCILNGGKTAEARSSRYKKYYRHYGYEYGKPKSAATEGAAADKTQETEHTSA